MFAIISFLAVRLGSTKTIDPIDTPPLQPFVDLRVVVLSKPDQQVCNHRDWGREADGPRWRETAAEQVSRRPDLL